MKQPQKSTTKYIVKEPEELLPFLMKVRNGISRNKAKAMLSSKSVVVNGKIRTQHDFPLEFGMVVTIGKPNNIADLKHRFVRLVYEDKYLMVVEKREGILTNGTAKETVQTVLNRYLQHAGQRCNAHVVHRLDRETSGLLVFTKDKKTELLFESDWKGYVTDRRYIAIASGEIKQDSGTLQSWLKDNSQYVTYSSPIDNGGKLAITHYRVLKKNEHYSLVELKLDTGRKNQIRVHLQDINHPVVGDIKYGNGDDPIGRLGLHAYRLCFTHPVTGEDLEFETNWPSAFRSLFAEKVSTDKKEKK